MLFGNISEEYSKVLEIVKVYAVNMLIIIPRSGVLETMVTSADFDIGGLKIRVIRQTE